MSVSREDIVYIAKLAHLELTPEEIERFTPQLNRVLKHAAELAEVDVGGVAPVGGVSEWPAPLRADEVSKDPLVVPIETLSDSFAAGFFTVPRLSALSGETSNE
jgi:aspartyl-tRNA(Asn)/glutamyl-tRNA(Gln) amidotransferase subunit C